MMLSSVAEKARFNWGRKGTSGTEASSSSSSKILDFLTTTWTVDGGSGRLKGRTSSVLKRQERMRRLFGVSLVEGWWEKDLRRGGLAQNSVWVSHSLGLVINGPSNSFSKSSGRLPCFSRGSTSEKSSKNSSSMEPMELEPKDWKEPLLGEV